MAAQDKVTFKQDLTEPVKIRHYEGVVFTGDDCGNLIKVALFDGGAPYSGGGTVSATAVLADGTTFPLTQGSITGNMVSVPLEAGALVISGLMGLYVKISGGGIICTVLNAIFTVQATDTGMVPAAMVTTVNELVAAIRDAQDSIPADLTNILAAVAPTFSTTTAYSAGAYVWQGGKLYRFTAAHPAGTWTGTDAVEVALGNDVADLKSASTELQNAYGTINKTPVSITWYEVGYSWDRRDRNSNPRSQSGYQAAYAIQVIPGEKYELNNVYQLSSASGNRPGYIIYNSDYSEIIVNPGTVPENGHYNYTFEVPSNGAYLCINCNSGNTDISAATALNKISMSYPKMSDIIDDIEGIEDNIDEIEAENAKIIGTTENLLFFDEFNPNPLVYTGTYNNEEKTITITWINSSTIKIQGTAYDRIRIQAKLIAGNSKGLMRFLHVDGIVNGVSIRYGSAIKLWDNNSFATFTEEQTAIRLQINKGATIDTTLQIMIVDGEYYVPYVESGVTAIDKAARSKANQAFEKYTGSIIEDNIEALRWLAPASYIRKGEIGTANNILNLLHFSDCHNDVYRISRFMQFSHEIGLQGKIFTGDAVSSYMSISEIEENGVTKIIYPSMNGWNSVTGIKDVMLVPGNHDWYSDESYSGSIPQSPNVNYISEPDMDVAMFSGTDWNDVTDDGTVIHPVKRPEITKDGVTYHASYWCKDYPENNVRIIGLDSWLIYVDHAYPDDPTPADPQQVTDYTTMMGYLNTWLNETLDANNNAYGYHVLILNHVPPQTENFVSISCNFTNKLSPYTGNPSSGAMDYFANKKGLPTISGTVQTFINNGGHFIAYLFGHIHNDYVGKLKISDVETSQIGIVIGTSNPSVDNSNDVCRSEAGLDLFNIVSIDTSHTLLKLIRVGATRTMMMMKRDVLCINYGDGTIIE